jgi:dCMP deaminase
MNEITETWKKRFLRLAKEVASWSKDPTTKVGSVAVTKAKRIAGLGYNGPPTGVADTPERFERPAKYLYTCHSEQSLVATAARQVLEGTTVFVTHLPCSTCAALLINAGVAKIVVGDGTTSMPEEEFEVAQIMLAEAGVQLEKLESTHE